MSEPIPPRQAVLPLLATTDTAGYLKNTEWVALIIAIATTFLIRRYLYIVHRTSATGLGMLVLKHAGKNH